MYMSDKAPPEDELALDFYNGKQESPHQNNMIIPVTTQSSLQLADVGTGANTSGDDHSTTNNHNHTNPGCSSGPKKRAETWIQEETRALISLRKEIDLLFNTSKSNKHLWETISRKMREKGFDRSPTMCTDKWRNLLKEYKKSKQNSPDGNGNGSAKMNYYKDIEEILNERNKSAPSWKNSSVPNTSVPKVDAFMHFADKAIDETSLTFGPVEADGRSTLNLERGLDHDGHPLAITAADAVGADGVSPWNWRETPGSGDDSNAYEGRVITIKLGGYTKRVGIDASPDAIKEAIKSAFGLRTKRAFWLEDEDSVIRAIDRNMPLGNYAIHVDEGLTVKICYYEESGHLPHTEDKTFYTDDEFHEFLTRRGWTCLREYNGYRNVDSLDELCPGVVYRGVR
ncbi:hypothetical protein M569_06010 [Genlisea aurea]|uniref:Myb-like domain-containing protein n=1 Tax=Genlisea aurea TaxID=192259 RepID=S8CPS6_9LAMI|nr:hypothetical protein M569_06010 [Genlisea aurea]